jgi:predicted O-linked N-acetylglucosamine transferase (SPINDLY family)
MGQVPGSHFRFVRPEGDVPAFRRNVLAEFAKRGVEAARVEFVAVRGTHLQHYNSIDVALDTFPHVGGTTTCETIWMGVPTVTLVGPAFFERMSCSNLTNAGLGDLCARTTAEYVSIAVALAGDRARLRSLRRGLRDSLRSLPLGDEAGFVRDFYAAAEAAARE